MLKDALEVDEGDKTWKSISFRRLDCVCKIFALHQGKIVMIQMLLSRYQAEGRGGKEEGQNKISS